MLLVFLLTGAVVCGVGVDGGAGVAAVFRCVVVVVCVVAIGCVVIGVVVVW